MNDYILLLTVGICIGYVLHEVYSFIFCKVAGTLYIDTTDENKDSYRFNVNVPLDELPNYKIIRVKIAHNTTPNMNE